MFPLAIFVAPSFTSGNLRGYLITLQLLGLSMVPSETWMKPLLPPWFTGTSLPVPPALNLYLPAFSLLWAQCNNKDLAFSLVNMANILPVTSFVHYLHLATRNSHPLTDLQKALEVISPCTWCCQHLLHLYYEVNNKWLLPSGVIQEKRKTSPLIIVGLHVVTEGSSFIVYENSRISSFLLPLFHSAALTNSSFLQKVCSRVTTPAVKMWTSASKDMATTPKRLCYFIWRKSLIM